MEEIKEEEKKEIENEEIAPVEEVEKSQPEVPTEVKEAEIKKWEALQDAMFFFYFSLGNKRSLSKVSKYYKIKDWIVKELSKRHKWQERLLEIDKDIEDTPIDNKLVEYSEHLQYALLVKILKDDNIKPSDQKKGLEILNELVRKAKEIKQAKRIVIEFKDEEKLKEVVNALMGRSQ